MGSTPQTEADEAKVYQVLTEATEPLQAREIARLAKLSFGEVLVALKGLQNSNRVLHYGDVSKWAANTPLPEAEVTA